MKYLIIFLIISGDSSIRASRNLSTFSFNVKLEASDEDNSSTTSGLSRLIRESLLKLREGSAFLKIQKFILYINKDYFYPISCSRVSSKTFLIIFTMISSSSTEFETPWTGVVLLGVTEDLLKAEVVVTVDVLPLEKAKSEDFRG